MAIIRRGDRERALPRLIPSFAEDFFRFPDLWEDMPLTQIRNVAADVYETNGDICVEMALPGIKPEDVAISVAGNTVSISGETQEEEKEERKNYYQRQLRYGSFSETIMLPTDVQSEKADATYRNGVIKVTLPKSEDKRGKQIKIRAEDEKSKRGAKEEK